MTNTVKWSEDLKLAGACAGGDERAMDTVYRTMAPKILTVCRRYTANLEEAQDCLHEGFIKVFDKIGSYRGESPLAAWVKSVVVNHTINLMKKKSRFEMSSLPDEFETEDESDEPEMRYDPELILRLISELPVGYRTVLNMYVFEEMTHEEIAARLGISPVTSRTQLLKARKLIKKKLENK